MNQTSKTNLTIRITNEGRQILLESARRLGLNRSAFIELAIDKAKSPKAGLQSDTASSGGRLAHARPGKAAWDSWQAKNNF